MWDVHMMAGSNWWILGPILMIGFWIGLFWVIASMTRVRQTLVVSEHSGSTAIEIVNQRTVNQRTTFAMTSPSSLSILSRS